MDTMRICKTREVVTTKTVVDAFEVPVLDFVRGLQAEVTVLGAVFLNGIMLKGVKLHSYHTTSNSRLVSLSLATPYGDAFSLTVEEVRFTNSHIPTTAKLVETVDSP